MNTANRKLTKLIAGRTIKQASQVEGRILIEFTDGSVMKIKSGDPAPDCAEQVVKSIRQAGTDFELLFDDASSIRIQLDEETSSIMLRDAQENMEYAD